ncbi:MAG: NADPH-dependent glutamate synthase [Thermodesulfobacteriota bacterium]
MDIKERMKISRQKMPEQKPLERIKNFSEVPCGYSDEFARQEALRCIRCKRPLCVEGCPVGIDIPAFIRLISEGKFLEAAWKLKEKNALPAVCGRVCPQEDQCEKVCVVGKRSEPVAIGYLERFAADYERNKGEIKLPHIAEPTGKRVGVVGGGPAGLTVAGDLIKKGHKVTIFEALHSAGGVLMYGIPEFRLPKAIVAAEVDYLSSLGVKVECNAVIGMIETVDELFQNGFDAIFLGTGAGLPYFMNVPGENLVGIYSANEYLTRANLMKAYLFPEYDTPIIRGKRVAVMGGGNTAMDSARTALRLGADKVYIVYRRSREEMPARIEEVHHGEAEGLRFKLLTAPVRFIGDDDGRLVSMECIKMRLGEPDQSGRRRPIPVEGSEFKMRVDVAIIAIGNGANPLIPATTEGLEVNKWDNIVVDPKTGKTNKRGVFSGGDIVRGGATVILAMGDGRCAANAIHEYLITGEW